ncbi:hypothetical protein Q9L58_009369 [Maublancomyces gigas]|uniref:Uncharacterized protein n=1 Tax=Discina gigas TaxID=1032678 RepID=A0ABR3G731_9PEZI
MADAKKERKKGARKWRAAIRQGQGKYWEETFPLSNKGTAGKVIKEAARSKAKQAMPDIQEISTFQGKCEVLRDWFFPANVVTPPSPKDDFPPV